MLRNNKISRVLSFMVIIALIFISVPLEEVKAAEDGQETFVITSFEKQDEWNMKDTTFKPGTEMKDMGFPKEWKVKGYLLSDKSKTEQERTLEKLVWEGYPLPEGEKGKAILDGTKLPDEMTDEKTDEKDAEKDIEKDTGTDEKKEAEDEKKDLYTKESKAGEYVFILQLPKDVVRAEDVKLPLQKIVIAEETVPEEPKQTPEEPKQTPEEPKQIPEEPKQTPEEPEPTPEEPKPEEKVWTLKVKALPERILKGFEYQLEVTAEGEGIDPENLPAMIYEAEEGNEVIALSAEGRITVLTEGNFKIKVSCEVPEGVICEPVTVEGTAVLPENDARIHSFKIGSREGKITEADEGSVIEVIVPYGTDVTSLKPEFTIGAYASVDKASGAEQNFTDPVIYTVTAEDGVTTRTYTVKVVPVCEHEWIEATCTEPETCKICKETRGEAKGHQWKAATCTEPEICTICKETRGKAKGHQWKAATCTEPKTCTVCKATEGKALGHTWGDWKVTKNPTTKEGGIEERICTVCKEKETREISRLNIVGKAENNYIKGIKEKGIYGVKEVITITAYGDGMNIDKPIKDDVRYVPAGWKVTSYSEWKKAPYKVSFNVQKEGEYELQVRFQKQMYDGEKWVDQKDVDVKKVKFTISATKVVPVKTADQSPLEFLIVTIILSALVIVAAARGSRIRKR